MKKTYLCSTNFYAIHNKDYSVVKTYKVGKVTSSPFILCLSMLITFLFAKVSNICNISKFLPKKHLSKKKNSLL